MTNLKSENHFIFIFLIGFLILAFFIFQPYIYAVIVAAAFATVFSPIHKKIRRFIKSESLAATLTTALIVTTIAIPLGFIGTQVFNQANYLYFHLTQSGNGVHQTIDRLQDTLTMIIPNAQVDLDKYLTEILKAFLSRFSGIASGTIYFLINLVIAVLTCFYFLRNATKIIDQVEKLLPLRSEHFAKITSELKRAVETIVRGTMTIALVQGLLVGIGFFFAGIPNSPFWGAAAAIAALIPGLGTALISIPGIIYLLVIGKTVAAAGLFAWSLALVVMIDNFLNPYLISRGINIHPFLVLLAIIGGIAFFGPLGVLFGPLTLSLLFALLSTYSAIQKEKID